MKIRPFEVIGWLALATGYIWLATTSRWPAAWIALLVLKVAFYSHRFFTWRNIYQKFALLPVEEQQRRLAAMTPRVRKNFLYRLADPPPLPSASPNRATS